MHGISAPPGLHAAKVCEGGGGLGFTKISQDRSGGSDPGAQAAAAESVKRLHGELCLE
jgi:hypothetical protein